MYAYIYIEACMLDSSIQKQTSMAQQIKPKDLKIVWGNDPRYWRLYDSSEKSYAELLQVCWLEVTAKFQGLEAGKEYSVGFNISFNQDNFGWNNCPMYLMAKVGKKGKYTWKKIVIDSSKLKINDPYNIPVDSLVVKAVAGNSDESDVYVELYEVWSGKWKGGLKIHSAFANPKP